MPIKKKPTTVKVFLKQLINLANTGSLDFSDFEKLTFDEQQQLQTTIAGIQNSLGDMEETLLIKCNLEWDN